MVLKLANIVAFATLLTTISGVYANDPKTTTSFLPRQSYICSLPTDIANFATQQLSQCKPRNCTVLDLVNLTCHPTVGVFYNFTLVLSAQNNYMNRNVTIDLQIFSIFGKFLNSYIFFLNSFTYATSKSSLGPTMALCVK
jgi:hypothetical protein